MKQEAQTERGLGKLEVGKESQGMQGKREWEEMQRVNLVKTVLLKKAVDVLNTATKQKNEYLLIEENVKKLQNAIQEIDGKITCEETETHILTHMKKIRKAWKTQSISRIQQRKTDLNAVLSLLSVENDRLYRIELEEKQSELQVEEMERNLDGQRNTHFRTLESKSHEWKSEWEFVSIERNSVRKIGGNERIERESRVEERGKVGVEEYWHLLRNTTHRLKTTVAETTNKVTFLRGQLESLKATYRESKLQSSLSNRRFSGEFGTRGNDGFEQALCISEATTVLRRILQRFSPDPMELQVTETCEAIVRAAEKCLDRADGR